jgi:hypothetical protein
MEILDAREVPDAGARAVVGAKIPEARAEGSGAGTGAGAGVPLTMAPEKAISQLCVVSIVTIFFCL